VLTKPAVLALSRAIEDEYCAQAAGGVLIASFQRERFYRQSQRRWHELARTAELAVALADFAAPSEPRNGPIEVAVNRHHALSREWAVVISAGAVQACLAAWERPSSDEIPDSQRDFEVLWSFEPEVVTEATDVAAQLIASLHSGAAVRLEAARERNGALSGVEPALQIGGAVAHRMVGYLGQLVTGSGRPPAPRPGTALP
jgi:DICT domain-containing protein